MQVICQAYLLKTSKLESFYTRESGTATPVGVLWPCRILKSKKIPALTFSISKLDI